MGEAGGGWTHQILQRPAGEATQPKLLSLFSCGTAAALRLCSGETDSNYRLLFLWLSEWGENHSMGNREKEKRPPPPAVATSSITLSGSETHPPPACGGLVYFEWCAIMTVQQISFTQVCGKWWNFRGILCKLLILSGGAGGGSAEHIFYTLKPDSLTAAPNRLTACSTLNLLRRHRGWVWGGFKPPI